MPLPPSRRGLVLWLAPLAAVTAAVAFTNQVAPHILKSGTPKGGRPASQTTPEAAFTVKPYLQPGDVPNGGPLALLWQTSDAEAGANWSVEVRTDPAGPWVATAPPAARLVAVDGVPPFRLYRASLTPGTGAGFAYRVLRAGATAFEADVPPTKPAGVTQRFVVFGDCAAGTAGQKSIAYQAHRARPDYVMITGDIVYSRGRISEYLDHFFSVYNADAAGPASGAPLLRSTLFFAAPGNHDLIEASLDKYPDGLGYFYFWAQPLNGPVGTPDAAGAPLLKGSAARRKAFLETAGPAYPRMANFSFDRGDVHWTVLDSNPYVDWTDPALRGWLEADLASPAARNAAWKIVAFHHPPFNSSKAHADDQRMRVLAPVFEKAGVAVVFGGHVHNYQRTRPLRFVPGPPPTDGKGKPYGPNGQVDGRWTLDTRFDGVQRTKPDGVVYVVTGAGGAKLYNPEQNGLPASWKDFTARFVSDVHSLTVVDVTPDALNLRQVSADGVELDRVVISR